MLEGWQTSGGSEWYADDLAAVAAGLHGVVLPKTDDPAKIATTVAASPAGVSVLPRSGGCRVPRLHAVDAWVRSTSGDLDSEGEAMLKRRVIVTGASKGIGRAVADRLSASGHDPIGLARTAPIEFPGKFYEVDLGDRAATAETLDKIVTEGRVDAVVNNVGLARFAHIGSVDLDDLFATYDMNVRTAVQVVQAALPGMVQTGWGRIVNVTSLTTLGAAERTPYAAAKAALEACTRVWAGELASKGITVNSVAPGPIETEMYRERSPAGSEREARLLKAVPLHRVGTPAEIAHVICMLLHEDAGYITGQTVRVDGGGSIAAASR